jgi:hypothetical protein
MGTSADVTGYLELLESMGAHLETIGPDAVRGTPTTRYRITPATPPNVPAEMRALGAEPSSGSRSASVELWADEAGRLRRFRTELGGQGSGGRYEVELFDFGAAVTIEAPPLDEVTTQPSGPEPGDYKMVASGRSDGSAWKIYTAPQEGGQCLAVEADVPAYYASIRGSDGGRVDLGCSASAASGAMAGGDPNGVVTDVDLTGWADPEALPLADGRALLVSEVPDGTTGVTLRLRDGGTKSATPTGGWFGAVLGHDEVAEVLEFATPSGKQECRLHGDTGYTCDRHGFDASSGSSSGSSSSGGSSSSATSTVPPTTPR